MRRRIALVVAVLVAIVAAGGTTTALAARGGSATSPEQAVRNCMSERGFDATEAELASPRVPDRFDGASYLNALYGEDASESGCTRVGASVAAQQSRDAQTNASNAETARNNLPDEQVAAAVDRWKACMARNGLHVATPDEVSRILEEGTIAAAQSLGLSGSRREGTGNVVASERPDPRALEAYELAAAQIERDVVGTDERCQDSALAER